MTKQKTETATDELSRLALRRAELLQEVDAVRAARVEIDVGGEPEGLRLLADNMERGRVLDAGLRSIAKRTTAALARQKADAREANRVEAEQIHAQMAKLADGLFTHLCKAHAAGEELSQLGRKCYRLGWQAPDEMRKVLPLGKLTSQAIARWKFADPERFGLPRRRTVQEQALGAAKANLASQEKHMGEWKANHPRERESKAMLGLIERQRELVQRLSSYVKADGQVKRA